MKKNVTICLGLLLTLAFITEAGAVTRTKRARKSGKRESMIRVAARSKVKPSAAPAPLPPTFRSGGNFYHPSLNLPGIGIGRLSMSESDLEIRTQNRIQAATFAIMRHPGAVEWAKRVTEESLQAQLSKAAQESGFPKDILEALCFIESQGDPNAVANPKSKGKGAIGIMQITKGTAKMMGLNPSRKTYEYRTVPQFKKVNGVRKELPSKQKKVVVYVDERLNPELAISAAARYLAGMRRKYGNISLALWAYHSGEGRMKQLLELAEKYGLQNPTAPELFFGNSFFWRKDLYKVVEKDMQKDYGPTYFFTVMRARELLALYRNDPAQYETLAEQFRNPIDPTKDNPSILWAWAKPEGRFETRDQIDKATGLIVPPQDPYFFSYTLRTAGAGAIGEKDPENRASYIKDTPSVVGSLLYASFETRELFEKLYPKENFMPLEVTSLVRDNVYHALVAVTNRNAAKQMPTHTFRNGVADISYGRLPPHEQLCLEFVLNDMRLDGYLDFFHETSEPVWHIGVAPQFRSIFTQIYLEAQGFYVQKASAR